MGHDILLYLRLIHSANMNIGLVVVENLTLVDPKSDVFNQVAFDKKKKGILRSLTKSFIESREGFDDVVAGKG